MQGLRTRTNAAATSVLGTHVQWVQLTTYKPVQIYARGVILFSILCLSIQMPFRVTFRLVYKFGDYRVSNLYGCVDPYGNQNKLHRTNTSVASCIIITLHSIPSVSIPLIKLLYTFFPYSTCNSLIACSASVRALQIKKVWKSETWPSATPRRSPQQNIYIYIYTYTTTVTARPLQVPYR